MKSSEKKVIIDNLQEQINSYNHFYLTDISGLNAENTSNLRRLCFNQNVKLVVVKNTLLRKALESSNKNVEEIYEALNHPCAAWIYPALQYQDIAALPAQQPPVHLPRSPRS